jgi:hypothetical protein
VASSFSQEFDGEHQFSSAGQGLNKGGEPGTQPQRAASGKRQPSGKRHSSAKRKQELQQQHLEHQSNKAAAQEKVQTEVPSSTKGTSAGAMQSKASNARRSRNDGKHLLMEESKPGLHGEEANSAGQSTTSIYKQEQAIRKLQPKDKTKQSAPGDGNGEPKAKTEHPGVQQLA